jgi:NAD(P)H-hydrate repair Nnr-like enzyme with NAD(P)H-hydrate dehydratase domain
LICAGDTVWQNSSGNPGLAAPGMGDVLAGMIAALIAQGANPVSAAGFGVWLHGFAADQCLAKGIGPLGLTASEVSTCARSLLNTTVSE